jgi:hypothetical protein
VAATIADHQANRTEQNKTTRRKTQKIFASIADAGFNDVSFVLNLVEIRSTLIICSLSATFPTHMNMIHGLIQAFSPSLLESSYVKRGPSCFFIHTKNHQANLF